MTTTATTPRALRTVDAARYLGVSVGWLRKLRLCGADDPGEHGPAFIRIGPNLVVYERSALDAWLDAHRARAQTA